MSSPLPPDPYEALSVSKDAEQSQIRTAHRKLVLKHHPDRVKDEALREKSKDVFQKIQLAYELLSDPIKRSRYDARVRVAELRKEAMMRQSPQTNTGTPPAYPVRPTPQPVARATQQSQYDKEYLEARPSRKTPAYNSFYEERSSRTTSRRYRDYEKREPTLNTKQKNSNARDPLADAAEKTKADKAGAKRNERRTAAYVEEDSDSDSDYVVRSKYASERRARTRPRVDTEESPPQRSSPRHTRTREMERDRDRDRERNRHMRRATPPKPPNQPRHFPRSHSETVPLYAEIDSNNDRSVPNFTRRYTSPPRVSRKDTMPSPLRHSETDENRRDRRPVELYSTSPYRERPRRAASVESKASSRNRSLRDSPMLEQDYQKPEFLRPRSGSGSDYEIRGSSPGLPPLPRRRASDHFPSMSSTKYQVVEPDYAIRPPKVPKVRDDIDHRDAYYVRPEPLMREPRSHVPSYRRSRASPERSRVERSLTPKPSLNRSTTYPEVAESDGDRRPIPVYVSLGPRVRAEGESPSPPPRLRWQRARSAMRAEPDPEIRAVDNGKAPKPSEHGPRSSGRSASKVKNNISAKPVDDPKSQSQIPTESISSRKGELHDANATGLVAPVLDPVTPAPEVVAEAVHVEQKTDVRDCYICGGEVKLSGKRDWQNHVFEDLRPYQCLEELCPTQDATYSRLRDLRRHYRKVHASAGILQDRAAPCLFCGEEMESKVSARFKHVARHLEEIALPVINLQYEDWEFYSESSVKTELSHQSSTPVKDSTPIKSSAPIRSSTPIKRSTPIKSAGKGGDVMAACAGKDIMGVGTGPVGKGAGSDKDIMGVDTSEVVKGANPDKDIKGASTSEDKKRTKQAYSQLWSQLGQVAPPNGRKSNRRNKARNKKSEPG